MNDSFLDELDELLPEDQKTQKQSNSYQFNQYITTRGNYASSTPESTPKSSSGLYPKVTIQKHSNKEKKQQKPSPNVTDKHETLSPQQKSESKSLSAKQKAQKIKIMRSKSNDNSSKFKMLCNKINMKEQKKLEKPYKECSTSSEASSKENSHPVETPVTSRGQKEFSSNSENLIKTPILSDPEEVTAFITMIKDLISTYTKAESTKIINYLQACHIDSKANLLKQLFVQTDDLLEELQPCKETNKLRFLIRENEKLREDIMIMRLRNEELRKKVQEVAMIKEENIELKIKLKELDK